LDALTEARSEAAEVIGSNDIKSAAYKKAIREILNREKLNEEHLHPQVRKSCWAIIENRAAIEQWREKLQPHEKMLWNSPDAVLRHWKASLPPSLKPTPRTRENPDPSGMLGDLADGAAKDAIEGGAFNDSLNFERVAELEAQIERLKAEVAELNETVENLMGEIEQLEQVAGTTIDELKAGKKPRQKTSPVKATSKAKSPIIAAG
jgi:hypothetical protein